MCMFTCACVYIGIVIVYIVAVRQPIGNIKAAWSGTKMSGLVCEMLCCSTLRSRIQLMLSIQMSPYSSYQCACSAPEDDHLAY